MLIPLDLLPHRMCVLIISLSFMWSWSRLITFLCEAPLHVHSCQVQRLNNVSCAGRLQKVWKHVEKPRIKHFQHSYPCLTHKSTIFYCTLTFGTFSLLLFARQSLHDDTGGPDKPATGTDGPKSKDPNNNLKSSLGAQEKEVNTRPSSNPNWG